MDGFGRRDARQAGHGHDVAADHHKEFRPGRQADLADRYFVAFGRALQVRVGGKAVLGLGDAKRKVAVAVGLQAGEAVPNRFGGGNIVDGR